MPTRYAQPHDLAAVRDLGVEVIRMPLAQSEKDVLLDGEPLIEVLLSLI